MSKLKIMRGLPASGKTTRAKEIVKTSGNYVRVNRDDLREMLHVGKWTPNKEKITMNAQLDIVLGLLNDGKNVIVDDTNLRKGDKEKWSAVAKRMNAKFEVEDMQTSLSECLQRDKKREKKVGEHVIWQMAISNGLWQPKKGIVLCDIDGTIANLDHRLHFVTGDKPDWKSFFENVKDDTLIVDVYERILEFCDRGYDIFFVSGRSEVCRTDTINWLKEYDLHLYAHAVFMRGEYDHRPDTDVKRGMLKIFEPVKHKIHCVIDDRPQVIRMWREEGIDVIDVGKGIEF